MAQTLEEREPDYWLLEPQRTTDRVGPSAYIQDQHAIAKTLIQKPKKKANKNFVGFNNSTSLDSEQTMGGAEESSIYEPTIKELANAKKPGFNASSNRPHPAGANNPGGFVGFNPGPGAYKVKTETFQHRFVTDPAVKSQLNANKQGKGTKTTETQQTPPDSQDVLAGLIAQKKNEEEIQDTNFYYTAEQGKIMQRKAPMAADKSMRSDQVERRGAGNIAPGNYKLDPEKTIGAKFDTSNQYPTIRESRSKDYQGTTAMAKIRNQLKFRDALSTVPSIPNKTQVFFIPETGQDEDDEDYTEVPDYQKSPQNIQVQDLPLNKSQKNPSYYMTQPSSQTPHQMVETRSGQNQNHTSATLANSMNSAGQNQVMHNQMQVDVNVVQNQIVPAPIRKSVMNSMGSHQQESSHSRIQNVVINEQKPVASTDNIAQAGEPMLGQPGKNLQVMDPSEQEDQVPVDMHSGNMHPSNAVRARTTHYGLADNNGLIQGQRGHMPKPQTSGSRSKLHLGQSQNDFYNQYSNANKSGSPGKRGDNSTVGTSNDADKITIMYQMANQKALQDQKALQEETQNLKDCPLIPNHLIESVGPGHYDPKLQITSKSIKGPVFKHSKTKRENPKDLTKDFPGPGMYNQQQMSISIKQIKNLLANETSQHQAPKSLQVTGTTTHQPGAPPTKIQNRLDQIQKEEHQLKKQAYVQKKNEILSKRGPGMYDIVGDDKEKTVPKEVFQFFGSTCDRTEVKVDTHMHANPAVGPGVYEPENPDKKRNYNNVFIGQRPACVFGKIPDYPGPQEYHLQGNPVKGDTFAQKLWSTNLQAFGSTEKRFAQAKEVEPIKANVPGSGQYSEKNHWASSTASSLLLSQKSKMSSTTRKARKTSQCNASFKSSTERTVDATVTKARKASLPVVGQYDEARNIGNLQVEGGAPNNFLLMKNDRLVAPFQSTVPKGWLNTDKETYVDRNALGMSSEQVTALKNKKRAASTGHMNFSKLDRFDPQPANVNHRIGKHAVPPDMWTYNRADLKGSFNGPKTHNMRFR